jgi:hypothetical protein
MNETESICRHCGEPISLNDDVWTHSGARFCIDNRVDAEEGDVAEPAMSETNATEPETFSPAFLDAERRLLDYVATLRTTADEIEALAAGVRASVAEAKHTEAGS